MKYLIFCIFIALLIDWEGTLWFSLVALVAVAVLELCKFIIKEAK